MKTLPLIVILLSASVVLAGVLTSTKDPENLSSVGVSWKSFDEGVILAGQQKKKLLIDVYTNWCSWCKKMDKEVYPSEKVRAALVTHFIAVKLDAESNKKLSYRGSSVSEQEFARLLGVNGYPTTLFFDEEMKPITMLPGYVNAESFADILTYVGQDHYRNIPYKDYLNTLKRPQ